MHYDLDVMFLDVKEVTSSYITPARMQNFEAIFLFFNCQKKQVKVMTSLFETQFLAFIIVAHENK